MYVSAKMKDIINIDSIQDYNAMRGEETVHPLVSVINFHEIDARRSKEIKAIKFGVYAAFLKDSQHGTLQYGRHNYDYQEGTLVFVSPGQVITIEQNDSDDRIKGYALLFHPDLLLGTSLGQKIRDYSFFSYDVHEALHISEKERHVILDCFTKIEFEVQRAIDKHSKNLITSNIELFLNYCLRFYDRQFFTRDSASRGILENFEAVLDDYFQSDKPQTMGQPSVRFCAEQLNLSPNYFGDLVKKETGISAQEYIQSKLMNVAKELLFDPEKSISEVAYALGFKYPQHFSRLFKQRVGHSPNAFRNLN